MFSVPLVGVELEWWVKCRRADSRFRFAVSDAADGVLRVSRCDAPEGIRAEFECAPRVSLSYEDARVETLEWVGCPYSLLCVYATEQAVRRASRAGDAATSVEVSRLDVRALGEIYRVHAAARELQRAFRRRRTRAAARAALVSTCLPADVREEIVDRL